MTTALGRIRRSLENPAVPLTSPALAEWMGGGRTKSGTLVSERRVMGIPAYYRAVAIKASVMAYLPVKIYEEGTRTRVLRKTVIDRPNPRQKSSFAYRQTMYMNAGIWGNAFAKKVLTTGEEVVETWPIHPSRARVEEVDPSSENPAGKLYIVHSRKGVEYRWTDRDVFHLPFLSPDGISGVSALQAFRESLGIAIAAEDAAAAAFGNGFRFSGLLKLKEADPGGVKARRLKTGFKQLYSGPESVGDIGVLDNGAEFQPISMPAKDAELLGSRQWSVSEIGRMAGVPGFLLGDVEKSTSWGSGLEQQFTGWVQIDVGPWAKLAEELYTTDLLPGGWNGGSWFAEHDLEGLLRGDSAAQTAFFASAIQWGWMNRNEVRVRKNLPPIEGLDEFLTPSNMTLISIDGTPIPLAKPSGGGNASADA